MVGCATAYALARGGASVCVVERDSVGEHASRAAAGMLAPLTESGGRGAAAQIGLRSLSLFPGLVTEIRELSGIDPQLRPSGILRVAREAEVEVLRERALGLAAHDVCWLDRDEVRKREPRVAGDIEGGFWSPGEAHVNSALLTGAFSAAAARRGARFEVGREVIGLKRAATGRVTGVRTHDGVIRSNDVVLCSGAWARQTESWLEVSVPIEPIKGQMLALDAPRPGLPSILWGESAYLVPRADGTVAVGATVENAGFDTRCTASGLAELLSGAVALMPSLGECAFRRAWAGLRPGTPDHLPLVGPVADAPGLTLAVGHYRNGVLLSPLTALALADWILKGERWAELAPLDPARFRP